MSSAWLMLLLAGLLEVCWATGLKYTEGFTKLYPSLFTLITLALSMFFLAKSTQTLPLGTAYAIWVGIGTVGASIIGIFLFKEPFNFMRLFFLFLLSISIIGLKFSSN